MASQKLCVYAFDSTTNLPKTGDAANLTAYVDKDWAGVNVLADTSAKEVDATNAKGMYIFDLAQAETNGDTLLFTCKSSTANVVVLAQPPVVFTLPPSFTSFVTPTGAAVNTTQIGGQTASAAGTVTFPGTIASTTNITAGVITTVGGNVVGSVASVTNTVAANVTKWNGDLVATCLIPGVPVVDVGAWNGETVDITPSGYPLVSTATFYDHDNSHESGSLIVADGVDINVGTYLGNSTAAISVTAGGEVGLDLTQAIPTSNTAQTVGDALNAARAQGFGKWTISGLTLTLYAGDGTTVVRTFTLDSATVPTSRS